MAEQARLIKAPSGFRARLTIWGSTSNIEYLMRMGLAYATSPRGACHLRSAYHKTEIASIMPPETIESKAELLVDYSV